MKNLIAVPLLMFSATCLADKVFIGGGTVFKDETPVVVHMGFETGDKHPWTMAYTFVEGYDHSYRRTDAHQTLTGGKQWTYSFNKNWVAYGELGVALFDKETRVSPSHFSFYETVGVKYKNVRFFLRHTSNAGLEDPNRGENLAIIAIDF